MKYILLLFIVLNVYSQENPLYLSPEVKIPFGSYAPLPADDSLTGSWKFIHPLPESLYGVNAYYIQSMNRIFICGGRDMDSSRTKCYMYDPASDSYEQKAPLPVARALGKLVRIKDSLYLIGSMGNVYTSPDGKIYKYDIHNNTWTEKTKMPLPYLVESAVCTVNDSLIYTIGGSSSGWGNISNSVRIYNPSAGTWTLSQSAFPLNITAAHAESDRDSAVIFVAGGVGVSYLNKVFKGNIDVTGLQIQWTETLIDLPLGFAARIAGGKWGKMLLFGPASRDSIMIPNIYGLEFGGHDTLKWTMFLPPDPSNASNRQTLAVDESLDSLRFYAFGGFSYPNIINSSVRFSAAPPIPIGIQPISGVIPDEYKFYQNYPNPFNPSTKIRFSFPLVKGERKGDVRLDIYNTLGRLIQTLINQPLTPGEYEITWNAANYPSGVYYYRLQANDFIQTKKMILIK